MKILYSFLYMLLASCTPLAATDTAHTADTRYKGNAYCQYVTYSFSDSTIDVHEDFVELRDNNNRRLILSKLCAISARIDDGVSGFDEWDDE